MYLLKYGGALALLLATLSPAYAAETVDPSTRAAARKIATDGVKALQEGRPELASQKLEKAFELLPAPSIALWSARALAKRGLLVEASERYLQAGRLPPSEGNEQAVQAQAQKDAARELAELTPRIPRVVLALEGATASEVQLTLDGKSISSALVGEEQPANPGAHQIVGVRGNEQSKVSFTLTESQKTDVTLRFHGPPPEPPAPVTAPPPPGAAPPPESTPTPAEPGAPAAPPPAPPARAESGGGHTLAFIALGLGGAGLIAGGVTGGLALSKRSSLHNNVACNGDRCLPSVQNEVDTFHTLRTASSVGLIAGGVLTAVGITLLITGGSSSDQKGERPGPRLALVLSPSNVGVHGSF